MVTTEEGQALADELGMKFYETSAKMNEGVEQAFFTLARLTSFKLAFFSTLWSTVTEISRLAWSIPKGMLHQELRQVTQ